MPPQTARTQTPRRTGTSQPADSAIDKGVFTLRNVPLGPHTITISAVGWKTYTGQVTVLKDTGADTGVIGLPSSLDR